MGFPRQEYWSGLSFPPPVDLPNPGTKPASPALAGRFFNTEPPGRTRAETGAIAKYPVMHKTAPRRRGIIWIQRQPVQRMRNPALKTPRLEVLLKLAHLLASPTTHSHTLSLPLLATSGKNWTGGVSAEQCQDGSGSGSRSRGSFLHRSCFECQALSLVLRVCVGAAPWTC